METTIAERFAKALQEHGVKPEHAEIRHSFDEEKQVIIVEIKKKENGREKGTKETCE